MEAKVKVLAEFFTSIMTEQAHWYRVFDPEENEADCQLIKSTFPSIATMMMMDPSYMLQLYHGIALFHQIAISSVWKQFNAHKSQAVNYLSSKIYEFIVKCTSFAKSIFLIRTNPAQQMFDLYYIGLSAGLID